jgi:hypothetical protein
MSLSPELLALLAAVIGALLALGYQYLKAKFVNLPDLKEIIDVVEQVVIAASENHDLPDNKARLDWALERVQKYLNATGFGRYFDARALVEYVLEMLKARAPGEF